MTIELMPEKNNRKSVGLMPPRQLTSGSIELMPPKNGLQNTTTNRPKYGFFEGIYKGGEATALAFAKPIIQTAETIAPHLPGPRPAPKEPQRDVSNWMEDRIIEDIGHRDPATWVAEQLGYMAMLGPVSKAIDIAFPILKGGTIGGKLAAKGVGKFGQRAAGIIPGSLKTGLELGTIEYGITGKPESFKQGFIGGAIFGAATHGITTTGAGARALTEPTVWGKSFWERFDSYIISSTARLERLGGTAREKVKLTKGVYRKASSIGKIGEIDYKNSRKALPGEIAKENEVLYKGWIFPVNKVASLEYAYAPIEKVESKASDFVVDNEPVPGRAIVNMGLEVETAKDRMASTGRKVSFAEQEVLNTARDVENAVEALKTARRTIRQQLSGTFNTVLAKTRETTKITSEKSYARGRITEIKKRLNEINKNIDEEPNQFLVDERNALELELKKHNLFITRPDAIEPLAENLPIAQKTQQKMAEIGGEIKQLDRRIEAETKATGKENATLKNKRLELETRLDELQFSADIERQWIYETKQGLKQSLDDYRKARSVMYEKMLKEYERELKRAKTINTEARNKFNKFIGDDRKPKWFNPGLVENGTEEDTLNYISDFYKKLATLEPEVRSAYDETISRIRAYNRWKLDYVEKKGLIGSIDRIRIQKDNPNYAPGQRELELSDEEAELLSPYKPTAAMKRKTLTGSSQKMRDVEEQMWEKHYSDIAAADINEVRQYCLRQYEKLNPEGITVLRTIRPGLMREESVRAAEHLATLKTIRAKLGPGEMLLRDLEVIRAPDGKLESQTVWKHVRLDDVMLVEAITQIDPPLVKMAMDFAMNVGIPVFGDKKITIGGITKTFQTYTTAALEFTVRNISRDIPYRLITDPEISANPLKLLPQLGYTVGGYFKAFGNLVGMETKELGQPGFGYEALMQSGAGGGGYWEALGAHGFKGGDKTPMQKIVAVAKGVTPAGINNIGNVFEQATRYNAAEMYLETMLKNDVAPEIAFRKAALKFKEATANFSDMGVYSKAIGKFIPFYTAGIAGGREFYRAWQKNPVGMTVKGFALQTIPALLIWATHKDTVWYQAITQQNLNVYMPVTKHFWWPKSFDAGFWFMTLPIATLDAMNKQRPETITEAMRQLAQSVIPQGSHPLINIYSGLKHGKDPFWGSPIEPANKADLLPHERAYTSTSLTTQEILKATRGLTDQEWLNLSPAKLDFIIGQLTSGYGRMILSGMDVVVSKATGKVLPEATLAQYPGIKAFYKEDPLARSNTEYTNDLFHYYQKSNKYWRTFQNMKKHPEKYSEKEIDDFINKNEKWLNIYEIANKAWGTNREYAKKRIEVFGDNSLSPQEMRSLIDSFGKDSNLDAKDAVMEIRGMNK